MTEKEKSASEKGRLRHMLATDAFVSLSVGALALLVSVGEVLNLDAWLSSTGNKLLTTALAFLISLLLGIRIYRSKGGKEDE